MTDWLDTEFADQSMGDKRLDKRAKQLAESLSRDPLESIPNATKTWEETLAAYRFFDNPKCTFETIMSGHKAATHKRIQSEDVVLIPQDTTFLNFATDDKSKEMGTLRTKNSDQQLLHTSLAITPSRVNLGIIHGTMWQREEKSTGHSRATKKISDKESSRWLDHYQKACEIQASKPEATIVSIADREGDIHEWFQLAEDTPEDSRAAYIIRAKANRSLLVGNDERVPLWDHVKTLKSLEKYSVNVPKRNGEPDRDATVDIYADEVLLGGKGKKRRPLHIHIVYVKENNPPAGKKGIEWMLLTNLPVSDALEARMIVEWYRCRWEIETYFRVIKGSCNIAKSRLRSEDKKLNCIAIYMIIAWRLHNVTMLSRRNSELPCSVGFSEREWKLLWIVRNKTEPPKEIPSIYEMVRLLASLGGFLMRKGDGEPGVKTVWRGYKKLLHYIEAADIFGV